MPNNNYRRGRDFEYRMVKKYKKLGYQSVFRSAGSHSNWDVVCIQPGANTLLIQCKVTKDKMLAKRMIARFDANPPMGQTSAFHTQCLAVYVPSQRMVLETFV